jgi:hypothetical protein
VVSLLQEAQVVVQEDTALLIQILMELTAAMVEPVGGLETSIKMAGLALDMM